MSLNLIESPIIASIETGQSTLGVLTTRIQRHVIGVPDEETQSLGSSSPSRKESNTGLCQHFPANMWIRPTTPQRADVARCPHALSPGRTGSPSARVP